MVNFIHPEYSLYFFPVLVFMALVVTGKMGWVKGKNEGSLSPCCCPRVKVCERQMAKYRHDHLGAEQGS